MELEVCFHYCLCVLIYVIEISIYLSHLDFTKHYNRARQFVLASNGLTKNYTSSVPMPATDKLCKRKKSVGLTTTGDGPYPSTSTDNSNKIPIHTSKIDSSLSALQARFSSAMDLSPVYNSGATRKGGSEKVLVKDRKDRATTEQVLDSRTRLVLFKMMSGGLISQIDGCVSTGKEV